VLVDLSEESDREDQDFDSWKPDPVDADPSWLWREGEGMEGEEEDGGAREKGGRERESGREGVEEREEKEGEDEEWMLHMYTDSHNLATNCLDSSLFLQRRPLKAGRHQTSSGMLG